jgi:hypothetical protein
MIKSKNQEKNFLAAGDKYFIILFIFVLLQSNLERIFSFIEAKTIKSANIYLLTITLFFILEYGRWTCTGSQSDTKDDVSQGGTIRGPVITVMLLYL